MADRKIFSRYNMRCGLIMRAEKACTRIAIECPKLDQRFMLLTEDDFQENNAVEIFSERIPLLRSRDIQYKGQIILALFGPDYESVAIAMSQIRIKEEDASPEDSRSGIEPLVYEWGLENEEELSRLRIAESDFEARPMIFNSHSQYKASAWLDQGELHIETPTQWPECVRKAVISATGFQGSVIVHPVQYTVRRDEYLLNPVFLSALAAVSTIRTEMPTEVKDDVFSARAGFRVHRKTYLNEEGKPVAEESDMVIDQGAYPIAAEEMQRQAMVGTIPPYALKRFSSRISIERSSFFPASFFGSLGFSEALASTAFHATALAESTDSTPLAFYENNLKEKRRFTDYIPAYDLEEEKSLIQEIGEESTFSRKWVANTFQRGEFMPLGYIRGLGMASGAGISGFSTTEANRMGFEASITLTQKQNVTINTSAVYHNSTMKYWKNVIGSRVCPDKPDFMILLEQNIGVIDSGPDVLSRFIAGFSSQLESAAKQISKAKENGKLPITYRFPAEDTCFPCEFKNSGFGAVSCSIVINEIDMIPSVDRVYASFSFSQILDIASLRNSLRRVILATIEENGFSVSEGFFISIGIKTNTSSDSIASIAELARGLTEGALANALRQALGNEAASLPTSAERLNRIAKVDRK